LQWRKNGKIVLQCSTSYDISQGRRNEKLNILTST
jgi:hypothetical protein